MNYKQTFLIASSTIVSAFVDISVKKITSNSIKIGMLDMLFLNREKTRSIDIDGVNDLMSININDFELYAKHIEESFIILSYSWLEEYLSLLEEILYLTDPRSIGDNTQIKLGKILEAKSLIELTHEIAKRRVKEKSSWGLKNRIQDLKENYGISISFNNDELEKVSGLRNSIVHDKRIGEIKFENNTVKYKEIIKDRIDIPDHEYLDMVFGIIVELYFQVCKRMHITRRNKLHSLNAKLFEDFKNVFKRRSLTIAST